MDDAGSNNMPTEEDSMADLLAFLDSNLLHGMGRMFRERPPQPPLPSLESKKREELLRRKRANVCRKLREVRSEWRLNGLDGEVCKRSCALYDALVYKFGKSNRRQRFWRLVRQIYTELKRINARKMVRCFDRFAKAFEKSQFVYRPSKETVCYLGSLLLERIIRLDRVRVKCARTADLSMGYVELKHLLTFNLMSIAIASDVWSEAQKHIESLSHSYDRMARWLRSFDKRFPTSVNESITLQSELVGKRRRNSLGRKSPKVDAILQVVDFSEAEDEERDGAIVL